MKVNTRLAHHCIELKQSPRRIAVHCIWPVSTSREKPLPLVLFSHGNTVAPSAYFFLARFWAAHGYVCILPEHKGQSERIDQSRSWPLRALDLSFCIDSLSTIEKRLPSLAGKLDATRIGVAGHSHGAYAVLLLAGARIRKSSFADSRIKAFLAISPPGPSVLGLRENSYKALASPLLTMSGSIDRDWYFKKPPTWRRQAFRLAPHTRDRARHHILIRGADHFSFIDAITIYPNTFLPPDPGLQHMQQHATLAYWNAYLKQGKKFSRKKLARFQRLKLSSK